MKWKLTHTKEHVCIENDGGKALCYNPNSGIQIIEQDGYAFKDLNNNGVLDAYEDWRLPLSERIKDFIQRFTLWQEGDSIYYRKGKVQLSKDFMTMIYAQDVESFILTQITIENEDMEYVSKNYMIGLLLLMFDNDYATGKEDCLLSLMVQSMQFGLLENIMYSIKEALKRFLAISRVNKITNQNIL